MTVYIAILKDLIFPGFAFLSIYSFVMQFLDRKLYARLQNRKGPPWYQPLADFFKLLGKETLIPTDANKAMFRVIPVFCLASIAAAFLYIPVWGSNAAYSFEGDLIVVLYLLSIPTLAEFFGGMVFPQYFMRPWAQPVY